MHSYLLRQRNGGLNSGLKSATFVTDALPPYWAHSRLILTRFFFYCERSL